MEYDLVSLGTQVLRDAERFGAQHAEVFLTSRKEIKLNVEKGAMKVAKEKHDVGCAIRAVIDKRLGSSFTSTFDELDLRKRAENAVSLANVSLPDEKFQSFPESKGSYSPVDGLFDPQLANLDSDEAVNLLMRTVEACRTHLPNMRVLIEASLTVQSIETAILNSLGIKGSYQETLIDLSADPTIKVEDGQASSFEFQIARDLKQINPEKIGECAAKNTLSLLRPKPVRSGTLPILFTPVALDFIFRIGFVNAFNAEEVQMGRSYLGDYLNEVIAPEYFTLRDAGLLPKGNRSRPFDSEGFPSQNTEIISEGHLQNFYHNSYTANKTNTENTGNASRASYRDPLKIAPTNIIITPGKGSYDELLEEMGKGLICRLTFDKPNIGTGEFSALIMEGYYVEKGEIQHPVKNTLIGINMRDFFKGIQLVGADTRTIHTAITPSLVIESAKISSN
ncbi:MAG: TldD/PmbA family protein [Candidatus Thorarchaeota archaeon]